MRGPNQRALVSLLCFVLFMLPVPVRPAGADGDQFPDNLKKAAKEGDERAFQSYLMKSDPRNPRRKTYLERALILAMKNGHKKIVEKCVRAGADVDADMKNQEDGKQTPLVIAIQEGQEEMVNVLISLGAEVDISGGNGTRPLHFAAAVGRTKIIKMLVNAGAKLNATNRWNRTPLHTAVKRGYEKAARVLIEAGAPLNTDTGRRPILSIAVAREDPRIVRHLLKAGADPNVEYSGRSPLHETVRQKNQSMTRLLLNSGANPNLRNDDGQTPLHRAAKKGLNELTRLLLQKGADPLVKDDNGNRPLDVMDPFTRRVFLQELMTSFLRKEFEKPPADRRRRVRKAIKRLGARSYTKRERAEKTLRALGPPALYALKRHYNHRNPEVRWRVRQTLRALLFIKLNKTKNPKALIPGW